MKKLLLTLLLMACFVTVFATTNLVEAAEGEVVIEPFAHYEFNDAENPGKDSSKHGFDLKKASTSGKAEAMQMLVDPADNDGYVSIRRDQYDNGQTKNTGAYLYAPQQGNTSYDFSDMVSGSYTVSFTFKSDNTIGHGDVYALTFGRYTSCLTIVPWADGIELQLTNLEFAPGETNEEKQTYVEANKRKYAISTLDWINLTVTADADSNVYCVYVDGELLETLTLPGVKLTSSSFDDYTFCIGAQCNIYGNSATQFGNVDVKDLAIYDCALSEENVKAVLANEQPTLSKQPANTVYVESVEQLDLEEIDLEITDVNTLDVLLGEGLPSKVKATTSNGVERSYPVYWYAGADSTIRGYVQSGYLNPTGAEVVLEYKYVAKFDYDEDLVTIKNIKLDGEDYVPGTPISSTKHLLQFEVEAKAGAKLGSVMYWGMETDPDDEGIYYVDILEGALVYIDAQAAEFTVTYMDGEEKLSTSKYTAGGNEQLKEFPKDGYTFEGWYLDAELTQKFEGLDYSNPSNITLYAKYVAISSGNDSSNGCGGAIVSSLLGLSLIAAGLFISKKKRK